MKHSAIVSIDLGSAYTKVGIRRTWNSKAALVRGLPIALSDEEDFCIPSVVARVESGRGGRWLIGIDAANQLPGKSVRIFRNWKASLFHNSKGTTAPGAAVEAHGEAIEVAIAFLGQLRKLLLDKVLTDGKRVPVRIAIPKLGADGGAEALMCDVLERAGWEPAASRPTIFEPESNALGLLSRGRNVTWVPPQQSFKPPPTRSIRMQQMLEPGLSQAFRTMSARYGVLVTDIGAFTTDFGFVDIDSSLRNDDWNRPEIVQHSVELGIRQLDEGVLNLLEPEVQDYFVNRPAFEWERRKQELYAGRPQRVVVGKRSITIGADYEGEAIQDEIQRFAKRVCAARTAFCNEHRLVAVHEEAVTGGGSAVGTLRTALVAAGEKAKRRVHDLWDPREPEEAMAAGARRMTVHEKEHRLSENRTLIRGGSAVGGVSVFFE